MEAADGLKVVSKLRVLDPAVNYLDPRRGRVVELSACELSNFGGLVGSSEEMLGRSSPLVEPWPNKRLFYISLCSQIVLLKNLLTSVSKHV